MFPVLFGHTGIWYAVIVAEVLAFLVSAGCLFGFRNKYGYL